jgi:hypothetical protein
MVNDPRPQQTAKLDSRDHDCTSALADPTVSLYLTVALYAVWCCHQTLYSILTNFDVHEMS